MRRMRGYRFEASPRSAVGISCIFKVWNTFPGEMRGQGVTVRETKKVWRKVRVHFLEGRQSFRGTSTDRFHVWDTEETKETVEESVRKGWEGWEGNENTDRWGKVYRERCEEPSIRPSIRLFALLWKGLKGRVEDERAEGEGEGREGRRRERWYVRRIASAFWAPRRFGLPSKSLVPSRRPRVSPLFFHLRPASSVSLSPFSISRHPCVSRSLSRRRWRRYLPFRASVSFIGPPTLSRSPRRLSHWRQQS